MKALILIMIAAVMHSGAPQRVPKNARQNAQLSQSLHKLEKLLLVLKYEELKMEHAAFTALGAGDQDGGAAFDYGEEDYMMQFAGDHIRVGTTEEPLDYDDEDDSQFELVEDKSYTIESIKTTPLPCKETGCPAFACTAEEIEMVKTVQAYAPSLAAVTRTACGKTYLFSNTEQTYEEAGIACCKQNMSLISIESQEELTCLQDMYKDEASKGSVFWSSGMYLGCPYQYRWCGSKQRFTGGAAWTLGEIETPAECVALKFLVDGKPATTKMSFSDEVCALPQKYICESETQEELDSTAALLEAEHPHCDAPICPELDCIKNPSKLVTFEEVCGRRYVLVDKKVSFVRAEENCCEMGMRLVSVETGAEQKCLQEWLSDKLRNNGQVWSSGTDLGCEGKYRFCGSGQPLSSVDKPMWMDGEPNNYLDDEDCLLLWNYNGKLLLNDALCTDFHSYVCEA